MRNSDFNAKKFQITLTKYSLFLAILTGSIALSVIVGWIFHVESLIRISPSLATMKFNTALCFILLSTSSLLSYKSFAFRGSQNKVLRWLINFFMVIVLTIAIMTLIEYIFKLNFGIDQLFVKDFFENTGGVNAVNAPLGRMGFNTAFCFLILAFVKLSLNLPRPLYFSAHILSCVVFLIALLAFLGLIYNTAYFNRVESYTDMALHTSLNFMIFTISTLFLYPHRGIMRIITNNTFGGTIARNVLPMIIILSPLLCGLILIGYEQDLYTVAMGFNLLSILYIITFGSILWRNSYFLDRIDFKRKQAENLLYRKQQQLIKQNQSLAQLNQELQQEIKKRQKVENILRESEAQYLAIIEDQTELICRFLPDGTLLFVNQAYCNYYGIKREKVIGSKYLPVIYPEDLPKIDRMLDSLSLENPVATIEHRAIVQGEIRWMQWVNRAIFDEEGNFIEFQSVGRDIHDRKQAEMQLQHLNEQLQSLLDNAPLSISLFDENGCYLEANNTLCNILNLSSKNIIGKTFEDLFPESLCQTFRERLEILKNTLEALDIEDEIIIDNQTKIFRSVLFPVMEEDNTVKIFWAIAYDITKQKQIEASLKTKTEELNRFFSVAIDLLAIANTDADFLRLNRQWEKTLGYSIEKLEGSKFFDYIHPEDLEKTDNALSILKNQHIVNNFVNRYRCYDGSYRWIEWSCVPVDNLIYAAARDITDRLKSENILRQYERIVSATNDAIALVKRDYTYQVVNQNYLDLHGKSYSEVVNHHIAEILDPEVYINVVPKVESCLSGETIQFEMWNERDKSNPQYLSVTYSPSFESDQTISGIVVSIRNITQLKQIEQQIEKSLREKEVLLKEIHHRVKNNLQVINSLLNLQSRSIQDSSIRLRFKESQTRIQSMALIHEHLYQSNNLSEINLSKYIKELINVLFSSYQVSNSTIEVKIKIEQNFFLDIDSALPCGLIINELISNVLKYAFDDNQKGKLFIGLSSDDQENLILTIADNGKGLPPELDWEKTTTLGLRLVKNLTNQLRGNIVLDNEQGTKWTITLNCL
ncbi:PAS domain S-box protein [Geminocystis sp. NIES-3709]|uniref:PAS domain S-box protein n=1 Tax=Geminocystis sp. NIES-3709 TaxID=1617448 RepID=UPI0005FC783C|nr:PAS domain S-box protein [Geminocystis sp. NIES-3709]BAQ66639.1 circadian input kinase A [Geminocystis sp. NIES-3709]